MKTLRKLWHGIVFLIVINVYFLSYPLAFVLYGKKKIWLISEVNFDARDNGIHFFKYLRAKQRNINAVYIISKNNSSYGQVKEIGSVVEPHSYKHMLLFIAAKAKISTLVHGCSPSWCITRYLQKHHGTGKNIALKHGIFKNLHPNYFKANAHLDLICCGAEPEFNFINNEFWYEKGVARYTGLARFDGLYNIETKNEILVMPTWRRWLDDIKDIESFKSSEFYKQWTALLKDVNFNNACRKANLKICFYVHPKLNTYIDLFENINKDIEFFNSINGDSVQDHLKTAKILITDYSSVFFDFAYMKKPSIYFQFDERDYFAKHYIKGYFDYRDNGFGPVTTNLEECLKAFSNLITNNFEMEKSFLNNANLFFPLYDNNNCERIYNSITEILIKK